MTRSRWWALSALTLSAGACAQTTSGVDKSHPDGTSGVFTSSTASSTSSSGTSTSGASASSSSSTGGAAGAGGAGGATASSSSSATSSSSSSSSSSGTGGSTPTCSITVAGGQTCTSSGSCPSEEGNIATCTSGACSYAPLGDAIACNVAGGTLRIDATYAYVAAAASLWRVPLAGGAVDTLATACSTAGCYPGSSMSASPPSLVVDDTSLYFAAPDGSLRAMPKAGGASVAVTTTPFRPGAVDATYVYGVDSSGTYPAIAKVAKGGGTPVTLVAGNNEWRPVGLSLVGSTLYFNQILTGQVFNSDNNQIVSVPVGGGATTVLFQQPPSNAYFSLSAQSGYVVWLTNDDGFVSPEACTTSGAAVDVENSSETCQGSTAAPLAFDGTTFFWADTCSGFLGPSFWIQPITGAAPTELSGFKGTQVWGLAVDATNVYIGLDGYLLKRAK